MTAALLVLIELMVCLIATQFPHCDVHAGTMNSEICGISQLVQLFPNHQVSYLEEVLISCNLNPDMAALAILDQSVEVNTIESL